MLVFAGSKKSLATGLPMATVLFGAQAGLAVLALMLLHQMQLMVRSSPGATRGRLPPAPARIRCSPSGGGGE
ncbi:bile acid:sodium symporter, partial [Streptomyces sp. 8N616]|uniref:bile acid:sodium symporter n=1 Tax=Streptomyces sp. 8N616 TaxID=3457414 RepID=UPI003FCEF3F5